MYFPRWRSLKAFLIFTFLFTSSVWANTDEKVGYPKALSAECNCFLTNESDCVPHGIRDVSTIGEQALGVELVIPTVDRKTGFVIGGTNSSSVIGQLTELNRIAIADLENAMRPTETILGEVVPGFLGENEKLLDILVEDNNFVVEHLGLTHQEIVRHLRIIVSSASKFGGDKRSPVKGSNGSAKIKYQKQLFEVVFGEVFLGSERSPFNDGTKANNEYKIRNLSNGKSLHFSPLVLDMVERYGFYEGHETPYRLEPKAIVELLPFLIKK